jgi:hypothetical protein
MTKVAQIALGIRARATSRATASCTRPAFHGHFPQGWQRSNVKEAVMATSPQQVPVETLALINQMQPDAALAAGQTVKWVVGGTKGPQPVSMAGR